MDTDKTLDSALCKVTPIRGTPAGNAPVRATAAKQTVDTHAAGFTLIETLLVLVLLTLFLLLGIPALRETIQRARFVSFVETTSALMQRARFTAIKENQDAVVLADSTGSQIVAFVDVPQGLNPPNRALDAGERVLGRLLLPNRIELAAPGTEAVIDFSVTDGPIFRPDGSVEEQGGIRFSDDRGNFLELRVDPPATSRIEIRKWEEVGGTGAWYPKGEGAKWKWL